METKPAAPITEVRNSFLEECKKEHDAQVAAYNAVKEKALDEILRTDDGPLTPFVLVARAVRLARAGKFPPCGPTNDDPVSNALFEALGLGEEDEDARRL